MNRFRHSCILFAISMAIVGGSAAGTPPDPDPVRTANKNACKTAFDATYHPSGIELQRDHPYLSADIMGIRHNDPHTHQLWYEFRNVCTNLRAGARLLIGKDRTLSLTQGAAYATSAPGVDWWTFTTGQKAPGPTGTPQNPGDRMLLGANKFAVALYPINTPLFVIVGGTSAGTASSVNFPNSNVPIFVNVNDVVWGDAQNNYGYDDNGGTFDLWIRVDRP